MKTFDSGIAWDAEADNEFVKDLNSRVLKEGLRPYLLHAYNFFSSSKDTTENRLTFRFFLDHSPDDDSTFGRLADFLKKKIKQASKLDFFSTEIVMKKEEKKFLVVDYVNDQPDMRRKSKFNDGVPDEIVNKAIENIISFVKTKT